MKIDLNSSRAQTGLENANLMRQLLLKNRDFSIISNNCCGSMIYRSLRLKKTSPTQDMIISLSEFPTFCRHLKEYLQLPVDVPSEEERRDDFPPVQCPLGILRGGDLPDIHLIFQHYKSFEDAQAAWYRRRERVNYENLFFLMDCGIYAKPELLDEFERLPSPNKVAFTHLKDKKRWPHTFHFRFYTEKRYVPAHMFQFKWCWPFLIKFMDEFPYIRWLNRGVRGDFLCDPRESK